MNLAAPRARVAGALVLALSALRGSAQAQFAQPAPVQLHLGVDNGGGLSIDVNSCCGWTFDTSKLALVARRAGGPDEPVRATFGPVGPTSARSVVTIPVALVGAPAGGGIYALRALARPGFVRARAGSSRALDVQNAFSESDLGMVSWPDLSRNDVALSRVRKQLVGKLMYGYGRIAISCPPNWTRFYIASTPMRVRSIERELGRAARVSTGAFASAPPVLPVPSVVVIDPLRIVAEPSDGRAKPFASNGTVDGIPGRRPEIELADWQVGTTLSLVPPPFAVASEPPPLKIGLTRRELIWTRGYPNEIGTKAELDAKARWLYGMNVFDRWEVRFRNDSVVSFTTPVPMP